MHDDRQASHGIDLSRIGVVDPPRESTFDRILRPVTRLLDAPIAVVSLVDGERVYTKVRSDIKGLDLEHLAGMCSAPLHGTGPFVIQDARADPVLREHPLVAGASGLRMLAGAPLATDDRPPFGSLFIADTAPRTLSADQLESIARLARMASVEMEQQLTSPKAPSRSSKVDRGHRDGHPRKQDGRAGADRERGALPPAGPGGGRRLLGLEPRAQDDLVERRCDDDLRLPRRIADVQPAVLGEPHSSGGLHAGPGGTARSALGLRREVDGRIPASSRRRIGGAGRGARRDPAHPLGPVPSPCRTPLRRHGTAGRRRRAETIAATRVRSGTSPPESRMSSTIC